MSEQSRFCINECDAWCCKNRARVIVDGRVGHFYTERRRCKDLTDDNLCGIYEERSDTCREYQCDKLRAFLGQK